MPSPSDSSFCILTSALRWRQAARLGAASGAGRAEFLRLRDAVLAERAEPGRGAEAFARLCAGCHRLRGTGQAMGPDLDAAAGRSREALLADILDPGAAVDPRRQETAVVLRDGRTLAGVREPGGGVGSPVVLRLPGGRREVFSAAEVLSVRPTGRSPMPEGLGRAMTVRELAEVIGWVRGE